MSGPTVHSLYCDLVVENNCPIKISSVQLKSREWSNDLLYQLTLRKLVCIVGLDWSFNVAFYINDSPACLKYTQASMFADDTNLSCAGKTPAEIEHKLNADLSHVNDWLKANKLTLNTSVKPNVWN